MDDTTPPTMLADRALVRLSGEDVRGFLQGLLTNDVNGPLPIWAGLLSPQGKALFDLIVWGDGDDVLLDVERDRADALMRRLSIYRLRRAITITRDGTQAVHWSQARPADISAVADPRLAELGFRWIGPAGLPADGWTAHRLSLGVAEGVADLGDGETLWLECNARELNGVSFAKGCYVGQENTARMHHRAKVNRRLVVAPLSETEPRLRARYPDQDVMIALRRTDALDDSVIPQWLAAALNQDADIG